MSLEIDDKEALRYREKLDRLSVPKLYLVPGMDLTLEILQICLIYQGMMRIFPYGGAVGGTLMVVIAQVYCDLSKFMKRTDDLKQARWRV